ncbi:MAG TPA: phosphoribosylformylglycinamidine synthase subunit PurL [Thermoplasmata archaeon]|nr:phosphoribosylformylglycinamidine synthase subunit PurL [Thermoplasmata archaeon]
MRDWADGVETVTFRGLTPRALLRVSASRGLGFNPQELQRIQRYFDRAGREPTDVELAGLAQSWSEHCSYKSSRRFLRRAFRGLRDPRRVLGTGDAGVMRFPGGNAYALRIESHNHPSAVEPYGGAATGIGGILRDVLAVGAEPIALADPLFFGPLDTPAEEVPHGVKSPRFIAAGVVSGIRDYGNRVGVPTVAGLVDFDPAFVVNPLVNVGCVGWLPRGRMLPNRARAAGDRLVLAGGRTGRDGIGGVAFASRELDETSGTESRGAVQLGNPILKEPLIRASLDAFDRKLVQGLKDLGGGGLATASGELVHAGGFGSSIDLARVPLRDRGLRPWEVWISESQERMLYDVRAKDVEELLEVFRERDVEATDIGEVVASPYETLSWGDRPAARLRLEFRISPRELAHPGRARARRVRPSPPVPDTDVGRTVEDLLLAPDVVSREPVVRVYDHEVMGRTVVKPLHGAVGSPSHGDAAVLRPRPGLRAGLAVTTSAHPWACQDDPYRGAVAVVEEAARNLYAVGARPDAVSDCLNFGSPENPSVVHDLDLATRGLGAAARALGIAVPSGNVSLYNRGLGREIPPTPVLLATGIVADLAHAMTSDLKATGNALYLLGRSRAELGGSLWARRHGHRGLAVPPGDPAGLRKLGERLLRASTKGQVAAAHDVADGGLAVTLAEMAFGGGLGFDVDLLTTGLSGPGLAAVAEGGSRIVAEVPAAAARAFERTMRGSHVVRLGSVAPTGGTLRWGSRVVGGLDLAGLYPRWRTGMGLP